VFTGSSSMLAEAIHSYADCGNQALLIWGLKEAKRSPTADHPLGFGKAIYFWSFIVALMLFSMGGLFSIYEGVHKLHDTEPVKYAWVAVAILGFGVAAESVSLWGCLREINKDRDGMTLWQWFRASRQSELLVVLGEDLAALGGLALAMGFIALAMVTGNPMWDAVGSIAIGVLLVIVAMLVGVEVKALLVGPKRRAACAGRVARACARPPRRGTGLQPADPAARQRNHGGGQGPHAAAAFGCGARRGDQPGREEHARELPDDSLDLLRARPAGLTNSVRPEVSKGSLRRAPSAHPCEEAAAGESESGRVRCVSC
jgi:hypothetical protein